MRHFWALCLALTLASAVSAASLPDVIDQVRGSIVGVGTAYPPRQPNIEGKPSGLLATGFAVGNGLQVITNAHVIPDELDVANKESLVIFSGRGKSVRVHLARVLRTDEDHDLVLLEIQPPTLPVLTLGAADTVREGQEVAFTGFPIGAVLGLYPVTHRGIVSVITPMGYPAESAKTLTAARLRSMRHPFNVFQLDATAYPGNSGSPVFEINTGRVIGVINSVFIKESKESVLQKPSGISYAIPVSYVKQLVQGQ